MTRTRNGLTTAALIVAAGSGARAGPDGPVKGSYDLVLANIIARILIELSADLASATKPGGTLVLAGIIEGREHEVRSAFGALGLEFVRRAQEEDWVSLVYRRPA